MLRVYSVMQLQHVWSKPMDIILEEPQPHQQQSSDDVVPSQVMEGTLQEEPESLDVTQLSTVEPVESPPVDPAATTADQQDTIMLPSPPPSHAGEEEQDQQQHETVEPAVPADVAVVQPEEEQANAILALASAEVVQQEEEQVKAIPPPAAAVDLAVQQEEKRRMAEIFAPLAIEDEQRNMPLPAEPPVHYGSLSNERNKRDSKFSTTSRDSEFYHEDSIKKTMSVATGRSLDARVHSFGEPEPALPPTPLSLKPSRSSQIQAKVATQRKRISLKLKRAFSISSKTNIKSSISPASPPSQ